VQVSDALGPMTAVLFERRVCAGQKGGGESAIYAGVCFRGSLICDDATTPGVTCDFGSYWFRSFPVSSGRAED
jgi:hypothetical protein